MSRPDYFTTTVEEAARYAADHADPIDADNDDDRTCWCPPGDPRDPYWGGPCRPCEEGDDE